MSEYPVRGSLRIPQQSFERGLGFIRKHAGYVSFPRPETRDNQETVYYQVEFVATLVQWQAIRPELTRLGIRATRYENPDLLAKAQEDEERLVAWIQQRNRRRLIPLAGIAIALSGLVLWGLNPDSVLIGWLIAVGLVVAVIGRVRFDIFVEKARDRKRTERMDR